MEPFVWVLIPLAAIGVGAFKEWLKFKSKQDQLGTSAAELDKTVGQLKENLEESNAVRSHLEQRVQNLEAIVTSLDWDLVSSTTPRMDTVDRLDESTEEETARIARRVRG